MVIKCIVVRVGQIPTTETFDSLNDIISHFKFGETFEAMQLNNNEPPYDRIRVIAHDQDKGRRKKNLLGIKGDFVIVGTYQSSDGVPIAFYSLSDDDIELVRKKLAMAAVIENRLF